MPSTTKPPNRRKKKAIDALLSHLSTEIAPKSQYLTPNTYGSWSHGMGNVGGREW